MITVKLVIASLVVFISLVSAFSGVKYGIVNGSVEFLPEDQQIKEEAVKSVRWKHNRDIAAEWYLGDEEPAYFRMFKNGTKLNTQTWSLSILNLQKNFGGSYSVEVNSKEPAKSVTLVVLAPVSKPEITKDCKSASCSLTCEAERSEQAQYAWSDSRGDRTTGPVWVVENPEGKDVAFTCNVSNPVSWEQVTVEERQTPLAITAIVGPVAGIVIALALALVTIYICYKKRHKGSMDIPTAKYTDETECLSFKPKDTKVEDKDNTEHPTATKGEDEDIANGICTVVTIETDEQPTSTKGDGQEVANGTCTVATIETDGPSDGVNELVTDGRASHNPASNQQDDRPDVKAENGHVALSKTTQQDSEGEMSEGELLKEEVEDRETPTSKGATAESSSSFLYQHVV